ncbi:uncharacterized protein J7T54_003602 [Emericellopsis cladophorae]|uniref:Tse2 ADP-ribosyltransferase toxin domain-containing protein n=1 Tax=Emericellopsis cladophorae TaxID=2686198 RepID=A0A9P9Y3C6_9HYPO|nr:uncharacterized protein J7T54_003602 [Emericellopsis cladophorae]KAI6782590.1 hypothetical protein J7T54_003602 [Emericellopsis cladophorae]
MPPSSIRLPTHQIRSKIFHQFPRTAYRPAYDHHPRARMILRPRRPEQPEWQGGYDIRTELPEGWIEKPEVKEEIPMSEAERVTAQIQAVETEPSATESYEQQLEQWKAKTQKWDRLAKDLDIGALRVFPKDFKGRREIWEEKNVPNGMSMFMDDLHFQRMMLHGYKRKPPGLVYKIDEGTPVPKGLWLVRGGFHWGHFSLQPAVPMTLGELEDKITDFFNEHAICIPIKAWQRVHSLRLQGQNRPIPKNWHLPSLDELCRRQRVRLNEDEGVYSIKSRRGFFYSPDYVWSQFEKRMETQRME